MTPRQLMALCDAHREFEDAGTRGGQPATSGGRERTSGSPGRVNGGGSAGWLMAVSTGLDRNRKRAAKRVNTLAAPTLTAPGVG